MATKFKQSLGAYGIIAGLSTLLGVLGGLQFRWSNQIRKAELQRKQAALESGMNGFREDLRRELAGICTNFTYRPPDPAAAVEDLYAQDCGDWERSSDHRELVANYYLWEKGKGDQYSFLQFNSQQDDSFQATTCPARLGTLCDPSNLSATLTTRGGDFGLAGSRWRLQGESLAMVRPIPLADWRNRRNRDGCPPNCLPAGFMIVELNRDVFLNRFLPELARRYFAGPDGLLYDVAIIDTANPPRFIYASPNPPSSNLVSLPDETVHLFSSRRGRGLESRPGNFREPGNPERRERISPPPPLPGAGRELPGRARGFFATPILADASAAGWRLVVRHPGGSLAEAAAMYWARDLLLGFGVLLVLAASMGLVLVWTQRIRRLARMQMDFVAGVSHELRTPVSVISSAAENLADGVVESSAQVKQYGALIRNEAQRLAAMIGQVLLFAATRNENPQYQPRPVPVAETIDSAVTDLAHLTTAHGFTVEKEVATDLPPVMADPKALGRCLQNLMTNALKYGSAGRWMAIRAQPGSGAEAGKVLITVQDRGPGIDPCDLPHIFEPFYRGNVARASQAHGTGLGLSLAKEAAEAMGGRLTVESRLGEGSAFTLHFPAAK